MVSMFRAKHFSDVARFERQSVGCEIEGATDGVIDIPKCWTILDWIREWERAESSFTSSRNGLSGTTAQTLRLCTDKLFAHLELIPRPRKGMRPLSSAKAPFGLSTHSSAL